jgi:hypothetical protein
MECYTSCEDFPAPRGVETTPAIRKVNRVGKLAKLAGTFIFQPVFERSSHASESLYDRPARLVVDGDARGRRLSRLPPSSLPPPLRSDHLLHLGTELLDRWLLHR